MKEVSDCRCWYIYFHERKIYETKIGGRELCSYSSDIFTLYKCSIEMSVVYTELQTTKMIYI